MTENYALQTGEDVQVEITALWKIINKCERGMNVARRNTNTKVLDACIELITFIRSGLQASTNEKIEEMKKLMKQVPKEKTKRVEFVQKYKKKLKNGEMEMEELQKKVEELNEMLKIVGKFVKKEKDAIDRCEDAVKSFNASHGDEFEQRLDDVDTTNHQETNSEEWTV
ncbi:unnamed protein product [Adineta steineri]|uniref:Uncharacterized protein n=1 Tax=Adineta steineri TaxID=433720 RepID=A0A815NV23_9BILA|nr:unnamed protein product [Adineta steineri]CAF1626918.1 unnamed protein product [Adineta steineri]